MDTQNPHPGEQELIAQQAEAQNATADEQRRGLMHRMANSRLGQGLAAVGILTGVVGADIAVNERPAAAYAEPFASSESDTTYEAASATAMERIAGADRIETAIEISQAKNPNGNSASVLLVNGWSFADSLTAAPIASKIGAPVLLAQPRKDQNRLDPRVMAEIERSMANSGMQRTVGILGGTAAISPEIENELKARGISVERLAGANRYATAVAANRAIFGNGPRSIMFADGSGGPDGAAINYGDALITAAGAATTDKIGGVPMGQSVFLPTQGGTLSPEVRGYLNEVLGRNPNVSLIAVGDAAINAVPNAKFKIGGGSIFSRAIRLTDQVAPGLNRGTAAFSSVGPDALAAPSLIAGTGGFLPAPKDGQLDSEMDAFIRRNADVINKVIITGGSAAVSEGIASQIQQAAGVS